MKDEKPFNYFPKVPMMKAMLPSTNEMRTRNGKTSQRRAGRCANCGRIIKGPALKKHEKDCKGAEE